MSFSRQINCFPMGLFRDADEPVICDNYAIFVQNSYNGSKIIIYNVVTGEMKSTSMKGILCFNVHADSKNIVFEFSGTKRGIGIINMETLEYNGIDNIDKNIILGGIWKNYIIFRREYDIVLLNIKDKKEMTISSCHHLLGAPVMGNGNCAWLQQYKDKSCVVFYDIKNRNNLILSSPGYINKMYLLENNLVYQNCNNNKCSIYTYDIKSGFLSKVFESHEWIELYRGRDGVMVWTDRRELENEYVFDVWAYSVNGSKPIKILQDCKNAVIPAASGKLVLWLDVKADGDSVYLTQIDV